VANTLVALLLGLLARRFAERVCAAAKIGVGRR
jgi:hypothetical protein